MNLKMNYYNYWGKSAKDNSTYHLLPYHNLDVAAVAWYLLEPEFAITIQLARQASLSVDHFRSVITFLLMIHDIGKFSKTFQALAKELFGQFFPQQRLKPYVIRHDTLGFLLWRGDKKDDPQSLKYFIEEKVPGLTGILEPLVRAGFGHHGMPPKESGNGGNAQLKSVTYFDNNDIGAAKSFVSSCLDILPLFSAVSEVTKKQVSNLRALSWQIAGLSVFSDWLGSDTSYFSYHSGTIDIDEYWNDFALPNAKRALASINWQRTPSRAFSSISKIFPFISEPTPLQMLSETLMLPDGPKLFIIEDVTGAGKTEAAIVLASRIMSNGGAEGLYIGLPTMATSNAMYDRMTKAYRSMYNVNDLPSIVLSHGSRHLSETFTETVALREHKLDMPYDDDGSASAYCNQWYADSRKKALLADVGVGTIDQVLISVLPARHQSLRLFGLQGKILIIDEVHAYDSYMEQLLSVLLESHARSGGSVILLSATIPNQKRKELTEAFIKGLRNDQNEIEWPSETGFPLLTMASNTGIMTKNVGTRKEVEREVNVKCIHDYSDLLSIVIAEAEKEKCICWIRNTVKDARKTYNDLLNAGVKSSDISLFHSRFAMVDRARIEDLTIYNFGKESEGKKRRGKILVATQVVEQSLDLDFDVMISDLAPIDLIIQRAGRLQRHARDAEGSIHSGKDQREKPILYVYSPEFDEKAGAHWLEDSFAGTAAIYKNVGILWRTLRLLLQKGGWMMPDDARELIESVYGVESALDVPDALIEKVIRAEGEDTAKTSMANLNALSLEKGYCENAVKTSLWEEDEKIYTRLTDETCEIALAVLESGKLLPYAALEPHGWDWSSLSISLREWKKAKYQIPIECDILIEKLKKENKRLQFSEIVIVNYRSDVVLANTLPLSDIYDPYFGWGSKEAQ